MSDFPQLEEKILNFWKQNKIFEKSIKARPTSRQFVFYEGPPTANGKPGLHHVLARIFKDIICRYKTMQGFRVQRKAGWDTHGLPVELEVEKDLGLKNKKEIEQYGIAQFNKKCKESVWKYKELWEGLTERIGYWLDLESPYITYSPEYIETVWQILKQIWQKGLLYRDYKVVPYCPRCGTSLSSHEVAQGYKKIKENAVYLRFKAVDEENTYFLVWTTTPWTLPANTALAIGEKINYVKVRLDREYLILAKDRLTVLANKDYQEVANFTALELVKKYKQGYIPPFPGLYYNNYMHRPGNKEGGFGSISWDREREVLYQKFGNELERKGGWRLWLADFVNTKEGTGFVHMAPSFGEDDFKLAKKYGFPRLFYTVNEEGAFTEALEQDKNTKPWIGSFIKEADPLIIANLKKRELLFDQELYEHDYPFCWRCKSPLLYYAKDTWFIKMTAVKERLIVNNQKINWVPSHLKEGRFGEWLREVKDWALSRERYWGTPLPIWQCQIGKVQSSKFKVQSCNSKLKIRKKCSNIKVISSIKELEDLSGKKIKDLHRPYIDEITFKCEKCGGTMKRVPEVIDCWFDSGAMPFGQANFPFAWPQVKSEKLKVKSYIEKGFLFPADYICEAIDQTRGWFYTLLAISTLLGFGPAYKNVISLGHILDEKGEKMSKSRGNVIDPWLAVNKYGADTVRWFFFMVNQPGDSKQVGLQDIETTLKRFIMTLWNCYAFWATYIAQKEIQNPKSEIRNKSKIQNSKSKNILDRWIISRLNKLIQIVTEKLDNYDITAAARALEDFVIDDLSLWYIRRSRKRFQNPASQKELKEAAETLGFVLLTISRLTAPFIPFLSEEIYQEVSGFRFPRSTPHQNLVGGLRGRQVSGKNSVHLEDWPEVNKKFIDKVLNEKMKKIQEIVTLVLAERAKAGIKVRQPIASLKIKNPRTRTSSVRGRQKGPYGEELSAPAKIKNKELLQLLKEEVNVKEIVFDDKIEREIELDARITPELREEGMIREVIRHIQEMRKEAGLEPKDKILVGYSGSPDLNSLLQKHKRFILEQGRIKSFAFQEQFKGSFDLTKEIKVGDEKLWLGIKKINN